MVAQPGDPGVQPVGSRSSIVTTLPGFKGSGIAASCISLSTYNQLKSNLVDSLKYAIKLPSKPLISESML